jgi:hypothetical protein
MRHLGEAQLKCALVGYLDTVGRDLDRNSDGTASISIQRFGNLAGLSRSPIARALRFLDEAQVMVRTRRRHPAGDSAVSAYLVTIQPLYERKVRPADQNAGLLVLPRGTVGSVSSGTERAASRTTRRAPEATEVVPEEAPLSEYVQRSSSEALSPDAPSFSEGIAEEKEKESIERRQRFPTWQLEDAARRLSSAARLEDPDDWPIRILQVIGDYGRFREWLDEVCDQGRNVKLRSYAGFLADAKRYRQTPRESRVNYPLWESPKFACSRCRDDPDGVVLDGDFATGNPEWCNCEHALEMKARRGDVWLESHRDELRALARAVAAPLETKPIPLAGVSKTGTKPAGVSLVGEAKAHQDEIIESVMCHRCREPVTHYADGRIQGCACTTRTNRTPEQPSVGAIVVSRFHETAVGRIDLDLEPKTR